MAEFFTVDATPWPRRLWDIGSLLALEELWEAGAWESANVLSSAACNWQRKELAARLGPDVGLGDRELRRVIGELLKLAYLVVPGGRADTGKGRTTTAPFEQSIVRDE